MPEQHVFELTTDNHGQPFENVLAIMSACWKPQVFRLILPIEAFALYLYNLRVGS